MWVNASIGEDGCARFTAGVRDERVNGVELARWRGGTDKGAAIMK